MTILTEVPLEATSPVQGEQQQPPLDVVVAFDVDVRQLNLDGDREVVGVRLEVVDEKIGRPVHSYLAHVRLDLERLEVPIDRQRRKEQWVQGWQFQGRYPLGEVRGDRLQLLHHASVVLLEVVCWWTGLNAWC